MTRRALVAAIAACTAWGQTPVPQPAPTFRTEANYVRVDVYPTRGGAPVADLTRDDFEILEGGQAQKIEQFERVVVRPAGSQDARIEPNTVRESRAMAESSRARVFVVFLDTLHVEVAGSHDIRRPLVTALDRLIGTDDLVAVMTPEMSANDLTFARKTTTIEGLLTRNWHWGERGRLNPPDQRDEEYLSCYPGRGPMKCPDGTSDNDNGVAEEMIERRHERITFDTLHDLLLYLPTVREERKAVIMVSDGWRQYRPNPNLARKLYCRVPTQSIGIIPGTGRISGRAPSDPGMVSASKDVCEADRTTLSGIDNEQMFRQLLDEANRANASFYPIDPRGLPAVVGPSELADLRARTTSLRTLAEATDGLAMVESNDLDGSFKKIVADLSAYYLLGYYSSGKLDGKFHAITVRVKRPGVQVRARRGFLARQPESLKESTAAPSASAATVNAEATAIGSAIALLANYARDVPLRLQAAAGWKPGEPPASAVWLTGELGGVALLGDEWKGGAVVDAQLLTTGGASLASARATISAGARTFRVTLAPAQPLQAGEYVVRVGARAGSATIPSRDSMHIELPAAPNGAGAIWIRRGPSTANRDTPTADLRFRRNETVRVEIPTVASEAGNARLLDRAGKELAVPVTAGIRNDADASRWVTAQLSLAALAPGDYIIELSEGQQRMLTAFRVIP